MTSLCVTVAVSPTADMQQCPQTLYDCSTLETSLTRVADVILMPDFVSSVHNDHLHVNEICRWGKRVMLFCVWIFSLQHDLTVYPMCHCILSMCHCILSMRHCILSMSLYTAYVSLYTMCHCILCMRHCSVFFPVWERWRWYADYAGYGGARLFDVDRCDRHDTHLHTTPNTSWLVRLQSVLQKALFKRCIPPSLPKRRQHMQCKTIQH